MAVSPTKKLHSPDRIISVAASQVNPNAAALGRSASYAVGTLLAWRAPYSVCVPAEVPAGRPTSPGAGDSRRVRGARSAACRWRRGPGAPAGQKHRYDQADQRDDQENYEGERERLASGRRCGDQKGSGQRGAE